MNEPAEIEGLRPLKGGQILITSRWQDWSGYAETLAVKTWDKTQAAEFLLKRTKRKKSETTEAEKVAVELGGLPLALEHAGAYLAKYKTLAFADYLQEFKEQKLTLLEEGQLSQQYHNDTIRTTWALALQKLPEAAADLLSLWAWFAPDNIPLDILPKYSDKLPETLAKVAAKKTSLAKAVGALQEYSLVEVSEDGTAVSMHRLLQVVVQDRSKEQEARSKNEGRNQESEVSSQNEEDTTLSSQHFWLSTALRLLYAAFPGAEVFNPKSWKECARLLPHILTACEEGERLEIEPAATWYLLSHSGVYLQSKGDYPAARHLLERALAIPEGTLESDDPILATSYNNLGSLFYHMGDYPQANSYYQKALAIDEKVLESEHPSLATIYNNLGELFRVIGDFQQANSYYQKAQTIFEKVLEPDHPNLATSYNNLGTLLQDMGDYIEAKTYYQKALVIREKVLEPDHPNLALSYGTLGGLLQVMGDYPQAQTYYQKALDIFEKVFEPNHPSLATSYGNLGLLFYASGDYPQAQTYYQKALAIFEKVLEPDHPNLATSYNSLGSLFQAMGDFPLANSYYQKALDIQEKVLDPDHPNLATSYNNLGGLFQDMGDFRQAQSYYQKSLIIFRQKLGDNHPDTRVVQRNLEILEAEMAGNHPEQPNRFKIRRIRRKAVERKDESGRTED